MITRRALLAGASAAAVAVVALGVTLPGRDSPRHPAPRPSPSAVTTRPAAAALSPDQQYVQWNLAHVYLSTDNAAQIAGEGHWICAELAARRDPHRDPTVEQAAEQYLCPTVRWLP